MTKFVVTITPPTPNGDLHIGHLSGPFLAADVFKRAQQLRGHDCVLVCYSDDYQSYMVRKGLEQGMDPYALARLNTDKIRSTLALTDVSIDHWHVPYQNRYFAEAVSQCIKALEAGGGLERRISSEPHCPRCDRWGYEAFGRGDCNYCGADSDASQCEGCAQEPISSEMGNFRCKLCGGKHEWLPVDRVFLKLDKYRTVLRDLFATMPLRHPLHDWLDDTIATKLHDWGVTRPHDGGLDLAPDGSMRVHTWFMGLAGYMAAFREWADQEGREPGLFEQYWTSPDNYLVHFLGFDCVLSHAIVYPAIKSDMPELAIKQRYFPNQFLTLDGLNLSTSRNHAIWMRDLVAEACSDSARLYLASVAPEEAEGDFSIAGFRAWRQDVFGTFVPHLLGPAAARRTEGGKSATVAGWRDRWRHATSLDHFSMKQLAVLVQEIIDTIRADHAAGRSNTCLALALSVFARPLTPKLSDQILAAFHVDAAEASRRVLDDAVAEYMI